MEEGRKDTLEERLLELAIAAQGQPPQSSQRQRTINGLVDKILRSGQLCYPYKGRFPPELYEEIYEEAIQQLWIYTYKNIDNFNPDRGSVLAWVNTLFDRRFFRDAIKDVRRRSKEILMEDKSEKNPLLSELVREAIDDDPENVFKTTHIRGEPRANWQFIALQRLDDKTWQEIALELDRPLTTVREWYFRNMPAMAAKIKQYL